MTSGGEAIFRQGATHALGKGYIIVQDTSGTIQVVNDQVLQELQVSASYFIGRNWKNFITPTQAKVEQRVIDRVRYGADPLFLKIKRNYHGKPYNLVQRITLGHSHSETPLILREIYPLAQVAHAGLPQGSAPATDNDLAFITEQIRFLTGVARRDDRGLLSYMLDMAGLVAEELDRGNKAIPVRSDVAAGKPPSRRSRAVSTPPS